MCGIAGFVSRTRRDGPAMVRSLHHRGPDAQGTHEETSDAGHVFLGHARLSIIDLSAAGTQPMASADGAATIVFNGEIYNFRELRERFLADVAFRSGTDTEVLLALYTRLGMECFQHLNGDFAAAILDHRRRTLVLVRDRIGVKPLYVWQDGPELVFASEVKALLAAGVPARLATEHLQKYFVFKYVPGDDTLFRGVRRLPPGHLLEYDLATGRSHQRAWWQPATATNPRIGFAEAREQVAELVADATRLRLVADVPIGNFLSGGLDSSIVASLLRSEPRIRHYCARQSEADVAREGTSSDFAHARRLADEWNLAFEPVDIGAAEITREQVARVVYYADDLVADSAQVPTFLITEGGGRTSRVFLSGMGADEIFLGYAGHLLALLSGYIDRVPGHRLLLGALAGLEQGRGRFRSARRYLYKLGKYRDYPAWRAGIFSLVGDFEASARLAPGDLEEIHRYLAGYFPEGADPFEGFKRFEFDNFLQKNLAYTDRMAMANGVEVRVPFLDHRVVELAYSLPRSFKLGAGGNAKRVLKAAFADQVPEHVVKRKKAGFAMPIRSIFGDRARTLALLDVPRLAEAAGTAPDVVHGVVDRHVAGAEDNSSLIFALLAFQEWHRTFFR